MIKGVNRRVVEVNEPESVYFERVLFFVKPDCCSINDAKLEKKADEIIKRTTGASRDKKTATSSKVANFLRIILSAGVGAAISAIIALLTGS